MKKQKKTAAGAQFAGTPPVQHSQVVLAQQDETVVVAQQDESAEKKALREEVRSEQERIRSLNEDDIEADRHNGSAGAFEATESERDED
ncbi:MAG TPA: hypothetical protein VNW04_07840 [Puia sp.]|nr:hypothetical protein [Puia sp.]